MLTVNEAGRLQFECDTPICNVTYYMVPHGPSDDFIVKYARQDGWMLWQKHFCPVHNPSPPANDYVAMAIQAHQLVWEDDVLDDDLESPTYGQYYATYRERVKPNDG